MKIFFVFNPKAGKERIKAKLGDIIELFSTLGHDVYIKATTKRGDATEWVRDLEDGFDRVICSGGDGTLDEVLAGMSQRAHKIPIGYIPAGSTNDFAMSLGLPTAPMEAAEVAATGRVFSCDLGKFNDKTFVYVAAFGLFTDVSYETPQDLKNKFGHAAYVMEGLKKLNEVRSFRMKVEAEGIALEDDFIYGMVTNSESVGGFKKITGENIDLNDGLFEVTLFKAPSGPIEMNSIINALVTRDLNCSMIYSFKASRVKFVAPEETSWTLDGEFGGNEKEVVVENLHRAFEIVIPE